jgi:hypothetical protein
VSHRFEAFEAHALLAPWLCERLFQTEAGVAPPLTDGMEVNREHLSQIIREAFPPTATFEYYGKTWGGLQAAAIIRGLYHRTIKGQYTGSRERLAEHYRKVLGVSIPQQLHRLRELEQEDRPLVEEARSFRGGGELSCGIIDGQETEANQLKVYELFGLLANFALAPLDKAEYLSEVHKRNLPRKVYALDTLVAYFRVLGVRAERNDIQVIFNQDIDHWGPEEFGVAQVVDHIEIDASDVPELPRLNRGLRQRRIVALLCLLMHPAELARRLRLPWPFPLYRFCSRDGLEGSIAFGRQALLLEVALQRRPDIECGGTKYPMIV